MDQEPESKKALASIDIPTPWILKSRWRLFGIFFLTLAVPTAIVIFLLVSQTHQSLRIQAIAQNKEAAKLSAQIVHEHFTGLIRYIESFANRSLLSQAIEEKNTETVVSQLMELVTHTSDINRVFIADPNGVEIYDYPHDPAVIGKNFSYRDWYQGVSKASRSYVSEVYLRAAEPKLYVVAIAAPIRNKKKEIIGYLVNQAPIEILGNTLAENRPFFAGAILLMDHHGFLATRSRDSQVPPLNLGQHTAIQQLMAAKDHFIEAVDPVTGEKSFLNYERLPSFGWSTITRQSIASVFFPEKKLDVIIVGFSLLALIMMLILGYLWINGIEHYHRMRQQAEKAIIRKTAQLARSQAELEQMELFAFTVTHDLKEPLHKIITFGNLLKLDIGQQLTEKSQYYLDCLQNAVERMGQNMDKLRELARLSSEKDISQIVDIGEIVQEILSSTELNPAGVERHLAIGTLPILRGNPTQMHHLFWNLIDNAFRFRKKDAPFELEIQSEEIGKESIKISVTDRGIGIDPKYAEQIFLPFKRLHTQEEYPGNGMGLAICRGIIKHHGGTITATGIPGKQTTFTITLPIYNKALG
ncbi:MAG: ATP-binding protein [Candidatus Omnitrophica bacterium]|nr:ATP-binding protein [Candidatus Omnitrophota bacterium]MDD5672443.1 ATP-binding protein [Candidatus Omnitrophota bacterium]